MNKEELRAIKCIWLMVVIPSLGTINTIGTNSGI